MPHSTARAVHDEFSRYKPLAYVPIITIRGVSYINTELFRDLKSHFVGPLVSSEYRFVIDSVEIDATSEDFAAWDVEVKLDTGARISLNGLNEFYDPSGTSRFAAGLKRILTKLKTERNQDPKLRRYFEQYGKRVGRPQGSASFREFGA